MAQSHLPIKVTKQGLRENISTIPPTDISGTVRETRCHLCNMPMSVARVSNTCGRCRGRQRPRRSDGPLVREAIRLGFKVRYRSFDWKPANSLAKAPSRVKRNRKTKPKVKEHASLPLWGDR